MKSSTKINGQTDIFGGVYWEEEPKPAKKQAKATKPRAPEYPFQCNIWDRYVIVFAQHPKQAYVKCKKMYGCCIGTPIQIG